MAKFYYNGVLLPEIPQNVLAKYPYAWIRRNVTSGYYDLICVTYNYQYYLNNTLYLYKGALASDCPNPGVWYRVGINTSSDTWEYKQDVQGGTLNLTYDNVVIWSNHDILNGSSTSTEIYLEGSEPIPEIAITLYQIGSTTLTSFADQARRIGGTTDKLTTAQMIGIFEGARSSGGGSLEGLENGYDVMFYDENNEGLAFYSIKQGHTINPPVYNCKNWQNTDGGVITFPYTPSADAIFYANNNTYASQLYKYYGVDSGVYPYLGIIYVVSSSLRTITIVFGDTITKTISTGITFSNTMSGRGTYTTQVDKNDIEAVCSMAMELIPTLTENKYKELGGGGSDVFGYTNFEMSDKVTALGGYYRLDE